MFCLQPMLTIDIWKLHFSAKRWYRTSHSSASNDSQKQEDLSPNDGNPASKANQLKKVFAIYGSFGIAFHIVTSLVSLGICYLIVSRYCMKCIFKTDCF